MLVETALFAPGLVVPDAVDMGGITKMFPEGGPAAAGRAAVEAVKAGNDMLLIPSDLDGAYNGLLSAVQSGEIPLSQIDQSVLKVLRAKASVGLNQGIQVDINAVTRLVARPENLDLAEEIADSAVTLVRDNHQVLPLKAAAKGTNPVTNAYQSVAEVRNRTVVLIVVDDSHSDSGRTLDHQLRLRIPDANVIYIDPRTAAGLTQPVMDAVQQADKVIAAVFASPVAGRVVREQSGAVTNAVALQESIAALLQNVLRTAANKTVVVAMGSPYIASQLPEVQTYLCTYSNAQVSEESAVKAIFGEIPMPGRLPVTIPNIAARGSGLGAPVPSGGPQ